MVKQNLPDRQGKLLKRVSAKCNLYSSEYSFTQVKATRKLAVTGKQKNGAEKIPRRS